MSRNKWTVSRGLRRQYTPQDKYRCEATIYIRCEGLQESARCRHKRFQGTPYCRQHQTMGAAP